MERVFIFTYQFHIVFFTNKNEKNLFYMVGKNSGYLEIHYPWCCGKSQYDSSRDKVHINTLLTINWTQLYCIITYYSNEKK